VDERKPRTVQQYKNELVRGMKRLGQYRTEYRFAVEILAGMFVDYDTAVRAMDTDENAVFDIAAGDDSAEDAACVFLSTLQDMKWRDE